jgi:CHASE3 domain sensor protein
VEFTVFNTLVLIAFGLLFTVTGGVIYLTLADWRDRRRREQEKQPAKQSTKQSNKRR